METFFSPERQSSWAFGPFLHFLVLLNHHEDYRAYARAHRDLFSRFDDHLGVVPEEWLHCTVQGIYTPTSAEQTEQLIETTRREVARMRPFTVQMGPTWPGVTGVTVAMYPETGVADLNERVRAAVEAVPGIALRPGAAKFWAHSTLAYVRNGEFDDGPLNRGLRDLRPERVDVTIDRVHLVNQRQDPAAGYYTWEVVEEFPFA
ncbi:2'-5' RNA ligase family protein [Streptomyces lydicus]|uniref:2'-5' RNA ligase family protein n=1 Tax=Streptomyces lydicus TaxID=47763 RepID=UPI00101230B6|nr:2'-5' RNA ligase family protein [Streptomyces lydicus]